MLGGGTPQFMDPALNSASNGSNVIRTAFCGLMGHQYDADGKAVSAPELAESVVVSDDALEGFEVGQHFFLSKAAVEAAGEVRRVAAGIGESAVRQHTVVDQQAILDVEGMAVVGVHAPAGCDAEVGHVR